MVSELSPAAPCSRVRFVGNAGGVAEELNIYAGGELLILCFQTVWCFLHSIPAMRLRKLGGEMALSPRHCFLSVSVHGNLGQFLFSCVVITEVQLPGGKALATGLLKSRQVNWPLFASRPFLLLRGLYCPAQLKMCAASYGL